MGKGDAYVYGSKVCKENSLWSIKDIRKYLVDIDKAKTIRYGSNQKVSLMCDVCKTKRDMQASDIKNNGFSCPLCSKNISYPELFFHAYLKVKNIEYEYQVKFDDSRRKIDFYIPSIDVFVEVHGIVHYKEQYGSALTLFSVIVRFDGLVVNSDNLLVSNPPSLVSVLTFILSHNSL